MIHLRFNYRRLRQAWRRHREGVPFEFLIKDCSRKVRERFKNFNDVYVVYDLLNHSYRGSYIVHAKLGLFTEKQYKEHGFRYVISIDLSNFNNGPHIRRSILHELRHIEQHEAGHDISGADINESISLQEYYSNPLERDAIDHEKLSTWF